MRELLALNKYLYRYKGKLLLGILFVTLANFFQVLIPRKIGQSLDYIFEKIQGADIASTQFSSFNETLLNFALLILVFAIARGICMYMMRMTIIINSRLIEYDLRKDLFEKYESLDQSFFKTQKTGDLMSRISEDVSKVRMYLGPALLYGINITSLFFLVVFTMFNVNTTLSLYTLAPLPFLSISIYFVSSHINKRSEIIQKQLASLNSTAQEVYSGIRVVKSYAKENQFYQFFDNESDSYKSKSMDLAKIQAMFFPLMILLIGISTLVTLYKGGLLVAEGVIQYGTIAEFIIYINYLTWPFTSIGWIASLVQQANASQKRINEFLEIESKVVNTSDDQTPIQGTIEFKNVSFTYPETGILALDNISFKVNKGQRLAIVGKTASGKSTIVELLLRTYDIDQGSILIDGKDIKEYNLGHLRQEFGYVPQDVFLFSDTIKANIRFGQALASDKAVEFYSDSASIGEDIRSFEKDFETMVGERGVTLSGGQKQRISIARAFIKEPNIIILDDSLSAVDAKTEHNILSYLNKALIDKTAIIITHRFFNLFSFDAIIVMENGKIVEYGKHEELLNLEGKYHELFYKKETSDP